MLQKIRIQGFKTVADVTIELGQLNVFVGANGAGKTNLFEAIALLGASARGQVDRRNLTAMGVRETTTQPISMLKKRKMPSAVSVEAWSERAYYGATLHAPPDWTGVWTFAQERLEEDDQKLAARDHNRARLLINRRSGQIIPIKPPVDLSVASVVRGVYGHGPLAALLDALEGFTIYGPHGSDPASVGGMLIECAPELQRDEHLWRRIISELRGLSDWVGDVSVQGLAFSDRFLRDVARWIPLGGADDGTRLVLYTLMLLLLPRAPGVLVLENADNALSPRLAFRLMERMQEILLNEPGRPQVLLVTQRPEVLDALNLRDDRVRLFVVRRERSGATAVCRFEYSPALGVLPDKKITLSEL